MFEFLIAFRYLLTPQKERFVSVINAFAVCGIALGVATLIVVMSVMNGYEAEMVEKMLGVQSHITLTPVAENRTTSSTQNYHAWSDNGTNGCDKHWWDGDAGYSNAVSILQSEGKVSYFAPVVEGKSVVQSPDAVSGAVVRGMEAGDLEKKPLMSDALIEGEWDALHDTSDFNNNVIVGLSLAQNLKVHTGDMVKLIVPQITHTVIGEIPRAKTFRIAGVFDVGRSDYNEMFVFVSLKSAQILFQTGGHINYIETAILPLDDVPLVMSRLQSSLSQQWFVTDWRMVNKGLMQALATERSVMFVILSLIIIIAAFNIISSLMILVKDKQKSIAVLRTMGATKSSVMFIFVTCGFVIGAVGTAIGGICGVLLSLNIDSVKGALEKLTGITLFDPMIYFLTTLPAKVCTMQVASVIVLSLVLSLLATIYPAVRIAGFTPSEALRYE